MTLVERAAAGKGVRCCFREVSGRFAAEIAEAAKLSDLIVFGPSAMEGGPDISGAFIDTLTRGHRPVLLAPSKPVTDLTAKIVIGWDGGAAAAHALSAALPFLARAATVELYRVREAPDDIDLLDGPVRYLALHGITAGTRVIDPKGKAPGAVLLAEADDGRCDHAGAWRIWPQPPGGNAVRRHDRPYRLPFDTSLVHGSLAVRTRPRLIHARPRLRAHISCQGRSRLPVCLLRMPRIPARKRVFVARLPPSSVLDAPAAPKIIPRARILFPPFGQPREGPRDEEPHAAEFASALAEAPAGRQAGFQRRCRARRPAACRGPKSMRARTTFANWPIR